MKNVDEIKSYLEDLYDEDLTRLWNEYCEKNKCYDDHIYFMSEFDEIMQNDTPETIARMIYYGNFNIVDNYFMFDGLSNLKSGYADELVCFDDIAKYIYENDDFLDDGDLEEFCLEDEYGA